MWETHGEIIVIQPGKRENHVHCTSKILEFISLDWLVVSIPLKNMSSSVGIIIPKKYGKIKAMFQTTNQWKNAKEYTKLRKTMVAT